MRVHRGVEVVADLVGCLQRGSERRRNRRETRCSHVGSVVRKGESSEGRSGQKEKDEREGVYGLRRLNLPEGAHFHQGGEGGQGRKF